MTAWRVGATRGRASSGRLFGRRRPTQTGDYDIGGLVTGTYRVSFEPEDNLHVGEYYDDVADVVRAP